MVEVSTRLNAEDHLLLVEMAELKGETVGGYARRCIMMELNRHRERPRFRPSERFVNEVACLVWDKLKKHVPGAGDKSESNPEGGS